MRSNHLSLFAVYGNVEEIRARHRNQWTAISCNAKGAVYGSAHAATEPAAREALEKPVRKGEVRPDEGDKIVTYPPLATG